MKNKNIGGICFFQLNLISKKRPQCKNAQEMCKKCKKKKKIKH